MPAVILCVAASLWLSAQVPDQSSPIRIRLVAISLDEAAEDTVAALPEELRVYGELLNAQGQYHVEELERQEVPAPTGEVTRIALRGYTFSISPKEREGAVGITPVDLQVFMKGDTERPLLDASCLMLPNRPLLIRGLKKTDRELAVIMMAGPPEDESESPKGAPEEEEEEESEEDKEEPSDEGKESEEAQDTQEDPNPDPAESEESGTQEQAPRRGRSQDKEQAADLEHIEALLQSIEEQDRQEQRQLLNQGAKAPRGTDWW